MAELIPVDTFDFVIFGGSGDLALRKLLPALFHRDLDGQFPAGSRIVALGRRPMEQAEFLELVKTSLGNPEQWDGFASRLSYLQIDATRPSEWQTLVDLLGGHEDRIRAVYLATSPELFGPVATGLRDNGLITENTRIVLEKPVGHDYPSALAINDQVGACFHENQIFRIDHYLGKETVQNLLALRFGNSLFEPLWRREVIDHVQITVAEELGVENRIDFYDDIGALRDMVQNHMLQLVCLVAMEPPGSLDDDDVRDEKIKVLRALKPITAATARSHTVRAQYRKGISDGQMVGGYAEALGAPSNTETFVAIKLEIDNWRWSGIPFYIRTGKRLQQKHSEIVIQFKPVPHSIFNGDHYQTEPNRLSIMLQPDEGIQLSIMAKEPGPGAFGLKPVSLDLSFEETFGVRYRDSYERLVVEVLRGNPALFMRRDEIESAWRWVDGILAAWEESHQTIESYAAGTWGPTAASMLLDRAGRAWDQGS